MEMTGLVQRLRHKFPYVPAVILCLVLGLFIRREAFDVGFFADDYAQIEMIEGHYPVPRKPYDLFNFSDGSAAEVAQLMRSGFYPWWAHPEVRIRMLRPLASLLAFYDHAWFGKDPFGYHVHSAVWWIAMLIMIAVLLRRSLPAAHAALAFLFVSCSLALAPPLWWPSNRAVLCSTVFGLAGLLAYMRYRAGASLAWLGVGCVCIGIAFGFGEYTFCTLGYVVAYELLEGHGPAARRLSALATMCLPAALFFALRLLLHTTVVHSGIYVDPLASPLDFIVAATTRVPVLIGDLLFVLRSDYWSAGPPWLFEWTNDGWLGRRWLISPDPWRIVQTSIGFVACACLWLLIRYGLRPQSWKRIAWLVVGSLLSILPVIASFPSSRLLGVPMIGFSALLSTFVFDALAGCASQAFAFRGKPAVHVLAGLAVLVHQVISPVAQQRELFGDIVRGVEGSRQAILNMDVDEAQVPQQHLVLLAALDGVTSMYIPATRRMFGRTVPRTCMYLSYVRAPYELTRHSARTFSIRFERDAAMLRTSLEQLLRAPNRPLELYERVDVGLFRATVVELVDGLPKRVTFEFDRPLEDPTLLFMIPAPDGFERFELPPIGASKRVPPPAMPTRKTG
jgi:hypothetical protein